MLGEIEAEVEGIVLGCVNDYTEGFYQVVAWIDLNETKCQPSKIAHLMLLAWLLKVTTPMHL